MTGALDPSDDLDYDPSLMLDQDSDGYWEDIWRDQFESIGVFMWALALGLAGLATWILWDAVL